jgi:hypothetical protein
VRPNSPTVWRSWSNPVRLVAALVLTLLVSASTACGMDQQTLRPYTPADGVNFDVGGDPGVVGQDPGVKVRNLMILSRAKGEGFLSAALVASGRNELTAISGKAIKLDGSDGAPITASLPSPVTLDPGVLVVLTDRAPINVTSPDLEAGLTAELTLEFSPAGSGTVQVPVIDANLPPYSTVTPAASPTPAA